MASVLPVLQTTSLEWILKTGKYEYLTSEWIVLIKAASQALDVLEEQRRQLPFASPSGQPQQGLPQAEQQSFQTQTVAQNSSPTAKPVPDASQLSIVKHFNSEQVTDTMAMHRAKWRESPDLFLKDLFLSEKPFVPSTDHSSQLLALAEQSERDVHIAVIRKRLCQVAIAFADRASISSTPYGKQWNGHVSEGKKWWWLALTCGPGILILFGQICIRQTSWENLQRAAEYLAGMQIGEDLDQAVLHVLHALQNMTFLQAALDSAYIPSVSQSGYRSSSDQSEIISHWPPDFRVNVGYHPNLCIPAEGGQDNANESELMQLYNNFQWPLDCHADIFYHPNVCFPKEGEQCIPCQDGRVQPQYESGGLTNLQMATNEWAQESIVNTQGEYALYETPWRPDNSREPSYT